MSLARRAGLRRAPHPDPGPTHRRRTSVRRVNTLRLELDGHVGRLVLARPDKLNSFTAEMWDELRTLGQELLADPGDLRALVVIGEGRAFSSGIDTSVFTTGAGLAVPDAGARDANPAIDMVLRTQESYPGSRDRSVRHDRGGARLRARRRAPDRACERPPHLRPRDQRRPPRAQVRHHPRPGGHPAASAPGRYGQGQRADLHLRAYRRRGGTGSVSANSSSRTKSWTRPRTRSPGRLLRNLRSRSRGRSGR